MTRAFLLTPQEHRDRAEYLRLIGTPKAVELATQHEIVAKLIEKRFEQNGADYPLSPA